MTRLVVNRNNTPLNVTGVYLSELLLMLSEMFSPDPCSLYRLGPSVTPSQ